LKEVVMRHWLLKSEPESWSWDDQVRKGAAGEAWTGVRNHRAKSHLKEMKVGDTAFFYHTGEEKRAVGIVEVIRESYPDPTDPTAKFVVVDVKAVEPLPRPVTLAEVKAEPRLATMALALQPRLSVQPVTDDQWRIVCEMGGLRP
jgi:predicted RNA-binding protein with PUA-like domain